MNAIINEVEFGCILRILKGLNLVQITDREELCKWSDGDWGEYWYLFKNEEDTIRVSFIDTYKHDKTLIDISFLKEVLSFGKKIYGNTLKFTLNKRIDPTDLSAMCRWNDIFFTDLNFKYGLKT
jgi:hypothetical protein